MSSKYTGRPTTLPKFRDKNQLEEKVLYEYCVNEVISKCIASDLQT